MRHVWLYYHTPIPRCLSIVGAETITSGRRGWRDGDGVKAIRPSWAGVSEGET